MDYRSVHNRYVRAKQDTEFKPYRIIFVGFLTGVLYWFFLSKHQFVEGLPKIIIAVFIGAIIFPTIEFVWNYFQAPLRLADEMVAELKAQISQYKATKSEQEIKLFDEIIKGRWFGQRFVFDEPIMDFSLSLPDLISEPTSLTLTCKANSLGHFYYIMSEGASVRVRTPGTNNGEILKGSGRLEMQTNENPVLEFESIEGDGNITWYTLGWTEANKVT